MVNINIPIKSLSVNEAWQGRRFKSAKYKQFENDVCKLLKSSKPIKGFVEIHYTFHIKNFGMTDIDNLIKPIQDIIVKRGYIEDDRKIVFMSAEKVKNSKESIEIEIREFDLSTP